MSRSERRQYQRMMKGADTDPLAPRRPGGGRPSARGRAEPRAGTGRPSAKGDSRPAAADRGQPEAARPITPRFVIRTVLLAALIGYLAFSLAWPNMPFALYAGGAVGAVTFLALFASRGMQFRMPQPPSG
jgi:hypothetical protein